MSVSRFKVRGMITISSNFETGVIVDVTSGVINQNYNVVSVVWNKCPKSCTARTSLGRQ
jgi:hypothetical protein